MTEPKFTNSLINASSPYLLQHAHNPVNWMEWGPEAMEKAKREDKLMLVSIGYSACHWCHVIEHECFEQEDTAAIMNEHFICIKVDREERPDVDQVYMDAVQLLTGRGGWPLNMFTLPDGRPLHGGTYFPKAEWERVLISLSQFYEDKKEEAVAFANDLSNGVRKLDTFTSSNDGKSLMESVHNAASSFQQNFDLTLGGYNWAPKFPMPNNWEFFLQYHYLTKQDIYKDATFQTLTKMAEGGINDALAGGFARYSTDSYWKVPHFEKMLYDNAQLMGLYAQAFAFSNNKLFNQTIHQIHHFIKTELTNPQGAFYSALDADSEGIEGKYYVWTKQELTLLLGQNEPLFSLYYSVDAYGNWEHGNNILYKTRSDQDIEKLTNLPIAQIEETIEKCRQILLENRAKRIAPGLDDKIICSWNALMIKGYAQAFKVNANPEFLAMAINAAEFMLNQLMHENGLYRIHKNGKSSIPAFAEDYATFCEALLLLFEVSGDEKHLLQSHKLLQMAIEKFYSEEKQLFFFTDKTEAELVTRKIDVNDDVIPSANSILGKCLLLHSFYFNKPEYRLMLNQMLPKIQDKLVKFPSGFSNWMQLILLNENGLKQVLITGSDANICHKAISALYLPGAIVCKVPVNSSIPLFAEKTPGNQTLVYICNDMVCSLPLTNLDEAIKVLKNS